MKKGKFYKDGLHFGCTFCGKCCSHPGGYVQLTEQEASNIADYLGMDEDEFLEKYIELVDEDEGFRLKSFSDGGCILLKDDQCTVYPVRPTQCRTFPFWPENVKSAYRWKLTAEDCPGIGEGRLYTAEEIDEILKSMKE